MPLKWFQCHDGPRISTVMCLENCRLGERCLTKSTLIKLAEVRPQFKDPSVTQLLSGPRLEYLKQKHDYSMKPEDLAFAFLGTMAHKSLELAQHLEGLNEERLFNDMTTGQIDNLEYEGNHWALTDYKTYGSYKVKRILENGDHDLEMQMNMLRLLIEKHDPPLVIGGNPVTKIEKLYAQIIVRDGGLWIAKKNNIDWKMSRLQVPILKDSIVEAFIVEKRGLLKAALEQNAMPRICNEQESWEGRRCEDYCPVKEFCEKHGDNTWLKKRT